MIQKVIVIEVVSGDEGGGSGSGRGAVSSAIMVQVLW